MQRKILFGIISGMILTIILLAVSFYIINKSYSDNSVLNHNLELFLGAVASGDDEVIGGLVNTRYVPSENVKYQIPMWRELYSLDEGEQIDVEIISCKAGQLGYNKIGGTPPYSSGGLKIRCSDTNVKSWIGGGTVNNYNVKFRLNGKVYFIEYNKELKLSPPYTNPSRPFLKKISYVPEKYKGYDGILPEDPTLIFPTISESYNLYTISSETSVYHEQGPVMLYLKSVNINECGKLSALSDDHFIERAYCYQIMARVLGDISICDLIDPIIEAGGDASFTSTADCVREFGRDRSDLNVCETLYEKEQDIINYEGRGSTSGSPYTSCVVNIISSNPSREGCELLGNTYGSFTYLKDWCYNSLAFLEKSVNYCDLVVMDDVKAACIDNVLNN